LRMLPTRIASSSRLLCLMVRSDADATARPPPGSTGEKGMNAHYSGLRAFLCVKGATLSRIEVSADKALCERVTHPPCRGRRRPESSLHDRACLSSVRLTERGARLGRSQSDEVTCGRRTVDRDRGTHRPRRDYWLPLAIAMRRAARAAARATSLSASCAMSR